MRAWTVDADDIRVAEDFDERLQRPSLWRTEPLAPPGGGEAFNVKKPGSDESDLWVRLYRLEL